MQLLHGKLQATISRIQGFAATSDQIALNSRVYDDKMSKLTLKPEFGKFERMKYAFHAKRGLKSTLREFREWSELFDIT